MILLSERSMSAIIRSHNSNWPNLIFARHFIYRQEMSFRPNANKRALTANLETRQIHRVCEGLHLQTRETSCRPNANKRTLITNLDKRFRSTAYRVIILLVIPFHPFFISFHREGDSVRSYPYSSL